MTDKTIVQRMTNFRWVICGMLFLATTINYMDRQVLSLTWKDFIAPEFHWTDTDYGNVAGIFALVYAIANLVSGRFIDRLGTKKGYLVAIGVWSAGACLHALCGWATETVVGLDGAAQMVGAAGATASTIAMVSVYFFMAARIVLAAGEAGNFPAAVKVTAEYFPKKDRAFATAIFNSGTTVGALVAPLCVPSLARFFKDLGVGNGWEMAFLIIGGLGFLWMGIWLFAYKDMRGNPHVNDAERRYILHDSGSTDTAAGGRKIPLLECLRLRQTWAIVLGKFLTDGVWWFFLFWTPAYISDVYGYASDTFTAQMLIFVLYAITIFDTWRQAAHGVHKPHGQKRLHVPHEGNAHLCRLPAARTVGAARGAVFVLADDSDNRHSGRGAPVVVGQPVFRGQRLVPQEHSGHDNGA